MPYDVFQFVGKVLRGQYRVDEVIGEGGFGVVYRGRHLGFDRPIAIKCLKVPNHFTEEGRMWFYDQFRLEGQTLLKLSEHPNVLRVFDCGTLEKKGVARVPYLILEWLDGHSLDLHIKNHNGKYCESEAIDLVRPTIAGLAFAHEKKIAHRDIKPPNIFVLSEGGKFRTKILDFGIAKAMQEGETATQLKACTCSGFSAFSPRYGAPEQFRPKRFGPTGPWTDVHAVGLILSEMLIGRRAYPFDTMEECLDVATQECRPTPRSQGIPISDQLEAILQRALALDPQDRIRDAGKLLEALTDATTPAVGNLARQTNAHSSAMLDLEAAPSAAEKPALFAVSVEPGLANRTMSVETITAPGPSPVTSTYTPARPASTHWAVWPVLLFGGTIVAVVVTSYGFIRYRSNRSQLDDSRSHVGSVVPERVLPSLASLETKNPDSVPPHSSSVATKIIEPAGEPSANGGAPSRKRPLLPNRAKPHATQPAPATSAVSSQSQASTRPYDPTVGF